MDEYKLGLCIGMLVGEGTVFVSGRDLQIAVRLHADDPLPLVWLHEMFGGKLYGPYECNGRIFRIWRATGRHARQLATLVYERMPPCNQRRRYALAMKRYDELRKGR